MGYYEFFNNYVKPFQDVKALYDPNKGFIVWRLGTGRNVELLHIRAFALRQGYGRTLFHRMLYALEETPPYYSVFGFTRVTNTRAAAFYEALGFNLQPVRGLYADGRAVMFWQSFTELIAARGTHADLPHR